MMTLEGKFMQVNVRNSNGRLYDPNAFETAFNEYKKKIDAGEAFGVFGDISHPSDTFSRDTKDISHRVIEAIYDLSTGEVFGKIELLDTPNGKVAQQLIKEFGELNIAPSSYAEVEDGKVVKITEINSFDIVKESAWEDAKVKPTKE